MDREACTSHNVLERILLDESAEPTNLPLSLLEDITNCFSLDHQIGSGGFAVVYKGVVGKGTVAVKKLSNTYGVHENKFQEEIKCLIKAKHKNIVRFLGYCADAQGKMKEYEGNLVMAEERNWLLCFDYACNGSLDRHITDATCGLNWRKRYQIIRGVSTGLVFLREKGILHLDLKPANILLDSHMVPKIADFGLSRCLSQAQTCAITQNIFGTKGYMDPEYIRSGQIGFASDVYSLGVIIMEILTGARRYCKDEHAVGRWMDRLGVSEGDMQLEQVRVCSEIAIECMDLDPAKRPDACHIIDRLDKIEGPDKSDKTGINNSFTELQVNLPREQFEERVGNPAAKSLQADVEEHSEILEDAAKTIERPHFQEGQEKLGQLSLCGGQDTMEKLNRHETSNSSSISTLFYGFSILDMYNKTAYRIFDRNNRRISEQSHFINIFTTEELRPIIMSSNLIREVNSAKVYKGVVDDALLAVKQMFNADEKQLKNEVIIQSQIIHKNIACLIGCCLEMDNPILVYEFLPRGTLHDILHSGSKVPLNLDVRLNIVAEPAQGLAYLHSQARTKILHGDVKSANILLDHNFVPKIAVFDLSRLIARDNERTSFVIGDMTYMDPVYMQTGQLTEKSDVCSFGVVILELISRKPTYIDSVWLVQSFIEFRREGKKATELFDKKIAVTTRDLVILDCLAEIAVDCNLDVDQRPTMTEVAERLVILNRSRRLHARHTSADYSEETDISSSFAEQRKVGHLPWGVQDTNGRGGGNSSSVSTGFFKLNNLDIFNWKGRRNFNRNTRHTLGKSHFIKIFRKEELKPIIRSANSIGRGAFGEVYKGFIDNTLVAVKIPINSSLLEHAQFHNQVINMSQVSHKNIVRLIGCCREADHPMLVFELVSNGTVNDILHGGNNAPLKLDVRLTIVAESAQGLAYLHSQVRIKILHGDVKPANILLDENCMPKIAGFGISRLITGDKEHTDIIGDMCYMDPVYLQTGRQTLKSDVYSFGIVILEVISRKKATHSDNNNLVSSFLEVHREGKKATELFDKEIAVTTGDLEVLDCLAEIAVECINLDVDQRPTMTDIAERLLILNRSRRPKIVCQ
uniref:non-specific serine/threonine protein kinase n=1 Tax=Triticum urartu TaxID=4572 RepID=A0A8R7Q9P5_TRIUA